MSQSEIKGDFLHCPSIWVPRTVKRELSDEKGKFKVLTGQLLPILVPALAELLDEMSLTQSFDHLHHTLFPCSLRHHVVHT